MVRRMLAPPFLAGDAKARHVRKLTLLKVLDWLELHPGTTWQDAGMPPEPASTAVWTGGPGPSLSLRASGSLGPQGGHIGSVLGTGLVQLIAGDVLRPGLPWLLAATPSPVRIAEEMARVHNPGGSPS